VKVLFARDGKRAGQALGYSPWMQPVHVENGAALMGRMADVEIVDATPSSLGGRVVMADARGEVLA
jgi:tRNA-2-methylthio-N6-dimethylallyladenosine synthase